MNLKSLQNIRYIDGSLVADVEGKIISFPRPCEAALFCGVENFVFDKDASNLSDCGKEAVKAAENAASFLPLRGEVGDFIMFAVIDGASFSIAALTRKNTTLTVRVEDVWEKLPAEKRKHLYSCNIVSSTAEIQKLSSLAPDARIFIDLKDFDGFVLNFTPEE
jgi:hypothetical protein